jgi:tRNA A-37 threonylcarbamoyl transferase component Bud32
MSLQLIGPLPSDPPVGEKARQSSGSELPSDILGEASARLGTLSLIVGVLWALGTTFGHIAERAMTQGMHPHGTHLGITDLIAVASIAASVALFVFTRRTAREPKSVLDLGLGYMVLTALALGLTFHWDGAPSPAAIYPQISWVGVMLLMFAAILPTSAPKLIAASLFAVAMNPIGMLISRARGACDLCTASNALLMHYPDFLLVGVAVVIARVVTRLGRKVGRARDMGSYELTELLGRGGMGEVYKARHRMLARPAAIKLIRPETLGAGDDESSKIAVKRFYREAEAAASLRSPHTVEIYDFGVAENQTLYFVMELLDGMDLESVVAKEGPLAPQRVIRIMLQACESLEEAHRAGLVHRDIKPANIHIGRMGMRTDFVKVLDFGLVKPFTKRNQETSLATVAGQTPGTPAYMAPEMALGEGVDGRADIYALGCVAYYLLTGHLVFEANTSLQMIARHLQTTPRPPSERIDRPIPKRLDEVVLSCLAKDPRQRPQTAAALARELAAIDAPSAGQLEARQWWTLASAPENANAVS